MNDKCSRLGTVKRVTLCAVLALASLGGYAQSKAFEKLAKIKGVECVYFDKDMVREAIENGNELSVGKRSFPVMDDAPISKMDCVSIYSGEEPTVAEKLKKSAQKLLKGDEWKTLVDMTHEGEMMKIVQSKKGDQVTNVFFVTENDETHLVVVSGSMDYAGIIPLLGKMIGK